MGVSVIAASTTTYTQDYESDDAGVLHRAVATTETWGGGEGEGGKNN